ncbi:MULTISPECIES: hypothetical protein [Clostridia]|uniref:Uncharacterized protein n=2 Tax=Clostridium perfringens TaxID=1502 RepID=A0AAP6WML1_CLOPF|nr:MULTISPECIES: hypothetical protein [Clostridia]EIF6296551.1 hypothetical protein [Clostridium perfringens]NGU30543.1 hypothetical protein [Clostridium perfringens]WEV05884.1 hypothetical protein PL322_02610 [Clostridium perfringens B]WEV08959.1 hypothetical protein PL324_02795 [Clostridium perfringens B]CEP83393.1 Uncharacterised protein [[Clostridium] sordellii] [Paeniclostridium sordellii]
MDDSNKLVNTSNTIIDDDNKKLTVTYRNSIGEIIDVNNYNLMEQSRKIKNNLGINKPTRVTRSAKKYDCTHIRELIMCIKIYEHINIQLVFWLV